MARPPAGLCDSCRHQRVVRNTRGSTLLALRTVEDRPRLSALSAPAGAASAPDTSPGPTTRRADMSRSGLVSAVLVALCGRGRGGDRPRRLETAGDGDEPAASATGRWTAMRPSLLARTEVAAARVGRFVYVVGGFERRSGRSTAAVERYDLRRDRWRRVRSMPVALNHPAAAAYRGDVYVLGGYTGRGDLRGEVASLYRYDPGATGGRGCPTRRPAAPRWRWASCGSKLYAAGGANSSDGALRTPRDLRLRRAAGGRAVPTWASRASTSPARSPGGAFYVLAGRAAGRGNFKVAERYLPARAALGAVARHGEASRRHRRRDRRRAGSSWSEARSSPARSARSRATTPPAAAGHGCRTCARRGTDSAWSPTEGASTRSRAASNRASSSPGRTRRSTSGSPPLPHRLLLTHGQQPPLLRPRLPDVDAHVDDASHPFQDAQRRAGIGVLGQHPRAHHVDDPEPPRLPGLRRRGGSGARLGRNEDRLPLGSRLLQHLVERHHLGAGALRARVEHPGPSLGHPLRRRRAEPPGVHSARGAGGHRARACRPAASSGRAPSRWRRATSPGRPRARTAVR